MSIEGSRYFLTFIDDYTTHLGVLDRENSEVFGSFLKVKSLAKRETGRKIKCLRSNGRKEYFSGKFNGYLQQMGIRREFSYRDTPEQNSVAERKNQKRRDGFGHVESRCQRAHA